MVNFDYVVLHVRRDDAERLHDFTGFYSQRLGIKTETSAMFERVHEALAERLPGREPQMRVGRLNIEPLLALPPGGSAA